MQSVPRQINDCGGRGHLCGFVSEQWRGALLACTNKYSWPTRGDAGGVGAGPATHATCTLITICQDPRCRARATRRAPRRAASLRARKLLKNGWPPHMTDRLHLRPLDHKRHAKSTPRDGPWPKMRVAPLRRRGSMFVNRRLFFFLHKKTRLFYHEIEHWTSLEMTKF